MGVSASPLRLVSRRMAGSGTIAVVMLVLVLGGVRPGVAVADPILGLADDGELVMNPANPDALLAVGAAHGVQFVRLIAYMGSYPHDDRYVQAAERVAAHGLGLDVVLALPWASAQFGIEPPRFAAWAARLAGRLAAVGAPLRLSILNEPDLYLTASDDCDPMTARRVVHDLGYGATKGRIRVAVRRTRIVQRTTRHPRRFRVSAGRRQLFRPRNPAADRHRPGSRLVWKVRVWKAATVLKPADPTIDSATMTVTQGCVSIQRARRAAAFLKAAIPAVRVAAPGIEVGAGETSPLAGVGIFMRELARVGIPPIDRWAHHPYPRLAEGHEVTSLDGEAWSDRLVAHAALARQLFGAGIPLDLTEFGVLHRIVNDPAVRASIWRTAFERACAAGARSIVAYQWAPTPAGQGRTWDSSIMGDGLTETPESAQLPQLRC